MVWNQLLVSVAHQQHANRVDDKGTDGCDTKRPFLTELLDHRFAGKTVYEATEATTCCGNAVCDSSTFCEPLWDDTNGTNVEEATAPTKEDTLGEEEVPCTGRKARSYRSSCLKDDANAQCSTSANLRRALGDERSDEGDL